MYYDVDVLWCRIGRYEPSIYCDVHVVIGNMHDTSIHKVKGQLEFSFDTSVSFRIRASKRQPI